MGSAIHDCGRFNSGRRERVGFVGEPPAFVLAPDKRRGPRPAAALGNTRMELPPAIQDVLKGVPRRADPVRDWLALLSVVALILGVILVGSARLFDTIANGGSVAPAAATTTPAFDESMLQSVRAVFAQRAAQEEKFASGTLYFTDPSQ